MGAKLLAYYFARSHFNPQLGKYLQGVEGLRVIWIKRNPLRVAVSAWYAEQLQNWNVENQKDIKERTPMDVPWDYVRQKLLECENSDRDVRDTLKDRPTHYAHYHELLQQLNQSMDVVCDFLHINRQQRYHTVYQRMTPGSFEDLVLNWKELRSKTPKSWRHFWGEDKD